MHSLGKGIQLGWQGQEDSSWLPVWQVGSGVPRAAPLHHVKHPTSTLLPVAPAPWPGLARPSMPRGLALHWPRPVTESTENMPPALPEVPTEAPQDFGGGRGLLVGSRAGAAGGPAEEPSCGDVAGMCVGGRQGGGEGGRGSGRGSSSFDKQLPEHFQTVVLDRHARRLRACARTDGADAAGQQVGSSPAHPCRPLERGPPPGSAGPWHPQAVGMCSLPGSPGLGWDAGQSDGDTLPAGAGSWGSSQGPPACQGLGCGISQVFPGWCARDVCWVGACCCLWSGSVLVLWLLGRRCSCPAWPGDTPAVQSPQAALHGPWR